MNTDNRIKLRKGVELLKALHFKPENIMITGSIALDAHGILPPKRKTHDVDFIVKMDKTSWGCLKLIAEMSKSEQEMKIEYDSSFKEEIIFLKLNDGTTINIWRYDSSYDWSDIKDVETGVYVATVDHIIKAKKKYGRAKDLKDINDIVKGLL